MSTPSSRANLRTDGDACAPARMLPGRTAYREPLRRAPARARRRAVARSCRSRRRRRSARSPSFAGGGRRGAAARGFRPGPAPSSASRAAYLRSPARRPRCAPPRRFAAIGAGTSIVALSDSSVTSGSSASDDVAGLDEDLDDRNVLEVADVGHAHFDRRTCRRRRSCDPFRRACRRVPFRRAARA